MPSIIGTPSLALAREFIPGSKDRWYDCNGPKTAEELWYTRHANSKSKGRLPPNVERKALKVMSRRRWTRCDDGFLRFL